MAEPEILDRSGNLDPAILLIDMDSFFASVEVRDDPSLRGLPVLVGGDGRRGVVASCSYEARRFGIHSAMPMATAKRLCPDAVIVPGDIPRYAAVSRQIHAIFRDVTPLVEPLAFDEAFLDVTGARGLFGTPKEMGTAIRSRIAEDLELGCAVGVGNSKMIAKLASKEAKPQISSTGVHAGRGVVVIMPDEVRAFLDQLEVRSLFGVGPATARTLERLGIDRVADLARTDPSLLVRHLGRSHAYGLVALARGEDDRPVVADQESKSIGHEETFAEDVTELAILESRLRRQAAAVAGALHEAKRRGRTITVKLKDPEFAIKSRSHTMISGLDDHAAIFAVARALLSSMDISQGVRLLGVTASNLETSDQPVQLQLGVDEVTEVDVDGVAEAERLQIDRASLEDAILEIRGRFGRSALGSASMLGLDGVVVPVQREVPFGPSDPA